MINRNTTTREATEKREHKAPESVQVIKVTSVRDKRIRFNILVDGAVYVYGMVYIEYEKDGKQGSFISFPQYQGTDKNYYNVCWFPINEELQADLEKQIQELINNTKD